VRVVRQGPIVSRQSAQHIPHGQPRELILHVDGFAHEALIEESSRLGVPADELAVFAILYYLADLDSNRIARRIPTTPQHSPGAGFEGVQALTQARDRDMGDQADASDQA